MWLRLLPFVSALMLTLALMRWPIGYYTALKWCVCIIAVVLIWHEPNARKLNTWSVVLAGIAILFNPVAPIYLDRGTWIPIDIGSAVVMVVYGVVAWVRRPAPPAL